MGNCINKIYNEHFSLADLNLSNCIDLFKFSVQIQFLISLFDLDNFRMSIKRLDWTHKNLRVDHPY